MHGQWDSTGRWHGQPNLVSRLGSQTELARSGSGVVAVDGVTGGEVDHLESLDAGQEYDQGLDFLAEARQIAADVGGVRTDFRSKVLKFLAEFLPDAPDGGSKILAQASDSRADFGAKGAEVATRFVPPRHFQHGSNHAYAKG